MQKVEFVPHRIKSSGLVVGSGGIELSVAAFHVVKSRNRFVKRRPRIIGKLFLKGPDGAAYFIRQNGVIHKFKGRCVFDKQIRAPIFALVILIIKQAVLCRYKGKRAPARTERVVFLQPRLFVNMMRNGANVFYNFFGLFKHIFIDALMCITHLCPGLIPRRKKRIVYMAFAERFKRFQIAVQGEPAENILNRLLVHT